MYRITSTFQNSSTWIIFDLVQPSSTDSEVLFAKYIENPCRKTNQKIHALVRFANFMTLGKRHLVIKTFFSPNLIIVL